MTIREVEERLMITRANVRFYEKEGLLFPKRNPLNDYRDYSPEDVAVLEKIIVLRGIGLSVDCIRQLQQGRADMKEVLKIQLEELKHQQEKTEEACNLCRSLMAEETLFFADFPIPEKKESREENSIRDVLSQLWTFWDKLVVWGFLAVQIFYTIVVYPLLPDQIPVTWQGITVTDYRGKWFIVLYVLLSVAAIYAARIFLYRFLVGGLRCYLEELNAIVTVGAIGAGFSMEVYVILYLKGLRISMDLFQLCCFGAYLAIVFLILIFYQKRKGKA